MRPLRILVVAPTVSDGLRLTRYYSGQGHDVQAVRDVARAQAFLGRWRPDAVVGPPGVTLDRLCDETATDAPALVTAEDTLRDCPTLGAATDAGPDARPACPRCRDAAAVRLVRVAISHVRRTTTAGYACDGCRGRWDVVEVRRRN